jgi:hypothetical protein
MSRELATCIGCGCDDNHACEDGCWWLRCDYVAGLGVCSQCEEHVEAWDRGDRTPRATPAAELEAIAEGALRIENPPRARRPDGCKGDHDWPFEDVRDSDSCRQCGMSFTRHIYMEMP